MRTAGARRCSASRGRSRWRAASSSASSGAAGRRSSSATVGSPTPTSGARCVEKLAGDFRCLSLDLPLGSHRRPMAADADLSPSGVAGLIATAVERLDLEAATLIGNDSGGAYSQIALTRHADRIAERVSGLVLTSCETPYDEWPPPPFDGLPAAAADPAILGQLLGALEDPEIRASPPAYGLLLKHPVESEVSDSYALPASRDPGVLRDVAKAMAAASTGPVRAAGNELIAGSRIPIQLIWSSEDEVFPIAQPSATPRRSPTPSWSRSTIPSASRRRTAPTRSPRRSGCLRSPDREPLHDRQAPPRLEPSPAASRRRRRAGQTPAPAPRPGRPRTSAGGPTTPPCRTFRLIGGGCEEAADQRRDEEVAEAHPAEPRATACRRGRSAAGEATLRTEFGPCSRSVATSQVSIAAIA